MRARIVQIIHGSWKATEVEAADLVSTMAAIGIPRTGSHHHARTQAEPQGQPTFAGFVGPMLDGGMLHYEDEAAYRRRST